MQRLFSFGLRFFISFILAKLILQALGVESRQYLVWLTLLFTANVYLFDYLSSRKRGF